MSPSKDSRLPKRSLPDELAVVVALGLAAVAIPEVTPAKNEDICEVPGRLMAGRVGNWAALFACPVVVGEADSTLITF